MFPSFVHEKGLETGTNSIAMTPCGFEYLFSLKESRISGTNG